MHARSRMTSHLQELQDRRVKLEQRLAKIIEHGQQPLSRDSEDRAQEEENIEVLDSLGNCSLDELMKVRKAIQRYETGEYGRCIHCGEAIAEARLEALPEAESCMDCATKAGN